MFECPISVPPFSSFMTNHPVASLASCNDMDDNTTSFDYWAVNKCQSIAQLFIC